MVSILKSSSAYIEVIYSIERPPFSCLIIINTQETHKKVVLNHHLRDARLHVPIISTSAHLTSSLL